MIMFNLWIQPVLKFQGSLPQPSPQPSTLTVQKSEEFRIYEHSVTLTQLNPILKDSELLSLLAFSLASCMMEMPSPY